MLNLVSRRFPASLTTATRSILPSLPSVNRGINRMSTLVSTEKTLVPIDSSKPLWVRQKDLPPLPVPPLEQTAQRYLDSCRPLLTPDEFKKTEAAVQDFVKPGGVGRELQIRLEQRAKETAAKGQSWLQEWWDSLAYMEYRDSVVINVSYFFGMKDDRKRMEQCRRAASVVKGHLAFRELINNGELQPEMLKTSPLDSHQYAWFFNSCRIPIIPSDSMKTADPKTHNHLVVVRNNAFYSFDTVVDGRELTTREIEHQLKRIIEMQGQERDTPVGALTSDNRDVWAKNRDKLMRLSPRNVESLNAIETSVFVLCLDDHAPVTRVEQARTAWHGDGKNRWYDKVIQLIVTANGKVATMNEHGLADASGPSRMFDWVGEHIAKEKIDLSNLKDDPSPINIAPPTKLTWVLDESAKSAIRSSVSEFDSLISKQDVSILAFQAFGKDMLKKLAVSPDAFCQCAMQLAFFKLWGKPTAIYETAMTRKFFRGRTETGRSLTNEVKQWMDEHVKLEGGMKDKGQLLRKAISSQTRYMGWALEGQGVDRHLLGLRLCIKDGETKPAIFSDPAYSKSCHWSLSTSQIAPDYKSTYGWGAVVSGKLQRFSFG